MPYVPRPEFRQITLGTFIARLKICPQDADISFDFCGLKPDLDSIGSYRGFYEQLAIGFREGGGDIKVKHLLGELILKRNTMMTGYKGGTYPITDSTLLWVANYGQSGGNTIVDVLYYEHGEVIIETAVWEG